MAKKKHTKKQLDVIYRRLYRAILKYGSAKVVIERLGGGTYGLRYIKKNGLCKVSYWQGDYSETYGKKYVLSCFYEDYTSCYCRRCKNNRATLSRTLKEMRDHDSNYLKIVEVKYGPRFSKKMKL